MIRLTPLVRLLLAATLLSAWLGALLVGWTLGGAIHLAPAAALLLFPWRRESS